MNELCLLQINTIFVVVDAIAAIFGIVITIYQIIQARKEVRRSYSPILLVEFHPSGTQSPITFYHDVNYPVVQNVYFILRNDGNGPALNMQIKVSQGTLVLERSVNQNWDSRGISLQEVYRNSLSRGERIECFFSVKAGFTPPGVDQPLSIVITCKNVYGNCLRFTFEAPMDFLSTIGQKYRSLNFIKMEELKNACQ